MYVHNMIQFSIKILSIYLHLFNYKIANAELIIASTESQQTHRAESMAETVRVILPSEVNTNCGF